LNEQDLVELNRFIDVSKPIAQVKSLDQ